MLSLFATKKYLLYTLPFAKYIPALYPKRLSIFATTKCNLSCFFCRDKDYKGVNFDFENLPKLKRAIKYAKMVDLTGWGEFLTYKNHKEVLKYVCEQNPKRVIMLTSNGTVLTEDIGRLLRGRIKTFVISINAATKETYERDMIGGNFEKTIDAIKSFMAQIDKEDAGAVVASFVAHKNNYLEIPEFVRLANELGIKRVSIGNYLVRKEEDIPLSLFYIQNEYNEAVWEARRVAESLSVDISYRRFGSDKEKNKAPFDCQEPFESCYVEADGRVGVCCYAGSYRLGNAYSEGFENVWFSKEYNKLRKSRYLDACKVCTPFIPFDDKRAHLGSYYKQDGTVVGTK